MAKGIRITSVTFEGTAHARAGRLTIPKRIAKDVGSGDDLPLGLRVEVSGAVVFDSDIKLASGTEAYPIAGVGPRAPITVTVRRIP